jgi:hypothetical protein
VVFAIEIVEAPDDPVAVTSSDVEPQVRMPG